MILVAVGTQKFPLNRLLEQVDKLVESGVIREEVFAQSGHSDYTPKHYTAVPFLSKESFDEKVAQCSLLITHSGVGTIISGMSRGKPIIVYPRLAKFGEHVDDHQLQIAQSFADLGYVLLCGETDRLADKILQAETHSFSVYQSQRSRVLDTVRTYLDTL